MFVQPFDRLSFIQGFTPEEIETLRPLFQVACLPAGAILFEQGCPADQFYIVSAGEVIIRYKPEDGPALILTRVREQGVVGWSAAIGSPYYTSSAVCAEESQLLVVRSDDLRRFYECHPHTAELLLERLAALIADRLRHTHPQIMAMLENGMRLPASASPEAARH
jgi:CRP-like cAMP-binding protein